MKTIKDVYRYIMLLATLFLMQFVDGYFATITSYVDTCNETIYMSSTSQAGILSYTHNPQLDRNRCTIVIETSPGYHIGYAFQDTSAFPTLVIDKDVVYYICMAITWFENGIEKTRDCVKRSYTDALQTTSDNKLTFEVMGDSFTSFQFDVIFFTFHYGQCKRYEVRCNAMMGSGMDNLETTCINNNLLCEQAYSFCDSSAYGCSDIVKADEFSMNTYLTKTAFRLAIVLLPVLMICVYMCHGKHRRRRREQEVGIPTRVRSMFAANLAEARENEGYNMDTFDPSNFDPPPEYGTLEHVDGGMTCNTESNKRGSDISIECPPDYGNVMSNSDEYLMCSHM